MSIKHTVEQMPAPNPDDLIRRATPIEEGLIRDAKRASGRAAVEAAKRASAERKLYTDEPTGLLSRAGIFRELDRNVRMNPEGYRFISFIDGNGVKAVNDMLGHAFGDTYLSVMADGIAAATRVGNDDDNRADKAGRYGGDEFLVFGEINDNLDSLLSDESHISEVLTVREQALQQSVREHVQKLLRARLDSDEPINDVVNSKGEVVFSSQQIIETLNTMLSEDYDFVAVGTVIYQGDEHDKQIQVADKKMFKNKSKAGTDERIRSAQRKQ